MRPDARAGISGGLVAALLLSALLVASCGGGGSTGMPGCPPTCPTPPPTNTPIPASVSGKVVQYGTSTAIAGATVKLGALSTVTDASGNYAFASVAILESPTVLYLQISASGYATYNTGVQLVSGANAIRTLALSQPNATEQTWLGQVNTDRANNGAGMVAFDEVALEAARAHATDMNAQGYCSHWDTNGYKPYARFAKLGGVGADSENWACGYASTAAAEAALMADPGHKANIIDPTHQWVGLGVASTHYDQEFVTTDAVFDPTVIGTTVAVGTMGTFLFRSTVGTATSADLGVEPNATPLTPSQLNNPPYNGGYSYPAFNPAGGAQFPSDATLFKLTMTFSPAQQYLIALLNASGTLTFAWVEAK